MSKKLLCSMVLASVSATSQADLSELDYQSQSKKSVERRSQEENKKQAFEESMKFVDADIREVIERKNKQQRDLLKIKAKKKGYA